jgi:hypothetical protein
VLPLLQVALRRHLHVQARPLSLRSSCLLSRE